jgi:DUF438 domain-containing protein
MEELDHLQILVLLLLPHHQHLMVAEVEELLTEELKEVEELEADHLHQELRPQTQAEAVAEALLQAVEELEALEELL